MTIYLDWNATSPPHPEVLLAMQRAWADGWGNPNSAHRTGQRARAELDRARTAVAALIGLPPQGVVLTSGGTEANNLALGCSLRGREPEAIVASAIEHPSILRAAESHAARGKVVRLIAPEPDGRVDPARVAEALADLGDRPQLVSLQAVNHETGVIQPVAAVAEIAHAAGALVHCDAVQALGKLDPSAWRGADVVTVAAHKMRGPKGIGALAVRPEVVVRPVLRGGPQERGLRPGTQDPAAAAGLAVAAERAASGPARYLALGALRDRLEAQLIALGRAFGIDVAVNGAAPRAPHVSNLSFAGWIGPELCAALDLEGVAVSSGAACSAGTTEPSAVIAAVSGTKRARAAVRISIGETTTAADLDAAFAAFERVLRRQPLNR